MYHDPDGKDKEYEPSVMRDVHGRRVETWQEQLYNRMNDGKLRGGGENGEKDKKTKKQESSNDDDSEYNQWSNKTNFRKTLTWGPFKYIFSMDEIEYFEEFFLSLDELIPDTLLDDGKTDAAPGNVGADSRTKIISSPALKALQFVRVSFPSARLIHYSIISFLIIYFLFI